MEFTIEIPQLSQFTAAFARAPSLTVPFLQRALSASSAILAKYTTKGIVPWRTGFLAQTFKAQMTGLTLQWFPTASYANFVEFGTAPHVITAKDAKALFWPGALHPVKSVNHPGTKGQDFMGRIVQVSQTEIIEMFGTALQQITEAIATQTQ